MGKAQLPPGVEPIVPDTNIMPVHPKIQALYDDPRVADITPKAGAYLGWDEGEQRYEIAYAWSKNGGGKDGVRAIASNVAELLNGVIAASGSRVLDPATVQFGAYDQKGKDFIYKENAAAPYALRTRDPGELILHGAFIGLSDLSERLSGGDVYVKRALSATLAQSGGDPDSNTTYSAGDFETETLFGNIAIVHSHASRKQNSAEDAKIVIIANDNAHPVGLAA